MALKIMGGSWSGGKWTPNKGKEVVVNAVQETNSLSDSRDDPNTWQDRLSEKEKDAVTTYTTSKYQDINSGLRNGNLSEEDKKIVVQLDAALGKSRLTKETKLYEDQRLYRASAIPEVNAAMKSGNIKGLEFTEKGFTSTTSDKGIAKNFQRGEGSRLFVINAPKGTKAGRISNLAGGLKKEQETLLARNTRYKVNRVEKVKEKTGYTDLKGKTKYRMKTIEYVHLDVIGQG